MSLRIRFLAVAAAAGMLATAAYAGPVIDFENAMRSAYADYRAALLQTNSGNQEASVKAIDRFRQEWVELAKANLQAPPQYADDASYTATMNRIVDLAQSAALEAAANKLADAHGTLEGIRDEIGGLHERNGVIGFSDRMNAYHAKMEQVLGRDYDGLSATGLGLLREDAAVLAFLVGDISAHPPAEAGDSSYTPLLDAVSTSVTALADAARAGDTAAARRALNGLKVPYSKFFLKFG